MATTEEFINYIKETFAGIEDISYRAMMGEYIIYYCGKIVGGVYDNRVLVKDVPSAQRCLPEARREIPYEGAKEMLYLEEFENIGLVKALFDAMLVELPAKAKRKK